jgi:hypothetical protein
LASSIQRRRRQLHTAALPDATRAPSLLDATRAPSLLDLRTAAAAPALPVQEVQGKQPAREVAAAEPAGARPGGLLGHPASTTTAAGAASNLKTTASNLRDHIWHLVWRSNGLYPIGLLPRARWRGASASASGKRQAAGVGVGRRGGP